MNLACAQEFTVIFVFYTLLWLKDCFNCCVGVMQDELTPEGIVYSEKRINLNSTAQRGMMAQAGVLDPMKSVSLCNCKLQLRDRPG